MSHFAKMKVIIDVINVLCYNLYMKTWMLSLPYKTNKEIADEFGLAYSTVSIMRCKLGIPTVRKWDRYKHLLGTMTDAELARKMGMRTNAVTVKRIREGISPSQNHSKEAKLQKEFVKGLNNYEEYVRTDYGIIDVLVDDTIYELKTNARSNSIYSAVGQLLMYSNAYPERKLVLVLPEKANIKPELSDAIHKLGIQIMTFG